MIRFIVVLVGAAIGFVVSSPVLGQAEPSAPLLYVAPDGTVTVNPGSTIVPPGSVVVTAPASAGGVPWVAGSAMGLSWSDGWGVWGNSTGLGLADRPQPRKGFAEGSVTSASPQSAASVVLASPSSHSFAPCAGCGVVAQLPTNEAKQNHNRSETSYALPQEFVNPYALIRPRPRIVADAGIKALLDFPKPREIKDVRPERSNEQRSEASSNRPEEKRSEAVTSKPDTGSFSRSDEKRSEAADLSVESRSLRRTEKKQSDASDVQSVAAASNGRDKQHAAVAELKNVVESTRPKKKIPQVADIQANVESSVQSDKKVLGGDKKALVATSRVDVNHSGALSKASIGTSANNVGGGSAGQVPEPATWALTFFGVLGASLLRRRKR